MHWKDNATIIRTRILCCLFQQHQEAQWAKVNITTLLSMHHLPSPGLKALQTLPLAFSKHSRVGISRSSTFSRKILRFSEVKHPIRDPTGGGTGRGDRWGLWTPVSRAKTGVQVYPTLEPWLVSLVPGLEAVSVCAFNSVGESPGICCSRGRIKTDPNRYVREYKCFIINNSKSTQMY